MGLFGFGKKKDKSTNKSKKNSKNKDIKAPIIFEDNEKFDRIISSIVFKDNYTDFGVKVGESLGEVTTSNVVVSNRVKLFLVLKNYKTGDMIFKGSDATNGITGKQYKVDCANYSQKLNCKFISDIDKEVEVARFYCLDLYGKDLIEFWRVVQVVALLSNRTDEINLKYLAIYDRLEQALIAIDVSKQVIADKLKEVIVKSYNIKLNTKDRIARQLQTFIEEIAREYEISEETWTVIYKYLNGVVVTGFKLKLDAKGIQLMPGFNLESLDIKKAEREEVSTIADMGDIMPKGELGKIIEEKEKNKDVNFKEQENVLEQTSLFGEVKENIKKQVIGKPLTLDDAEDFGDNSDSFKGDVIRFEDYKKSLASEDNTSRFNFRKLSGEELLGKSPIICVKMSDIMKSYFYSDSFNAVIRQIFNLNIALNSTYNVQNCIIQLCSNYNAMELSHSELDDLLETLTNSDIELVDFHFTNVLEVMRELLENEKGRVIFVIYDKIIDKTASIKKMREMCDIFENNKVIFIQLDEDVASNYDDFMCKEESLFTNCNHILADKDLVCKPINLGTKLRDSLFN